MEDQLQLKANEATALSIKELFFKYVRFLPLFVLSVILALLVAYVYLRYATPTYQSSGALILKSDDDGGGGVNDRFSQLFVLDKSLNVQNEIEVLKSRQLMERVVTDPNLNLNFTYYGVGKIREINLYKEAP